MPQAHTLHHEEYCRIIGQLYIDAHTRISSLEQQAGANNALPMVAALQKQLDVATKRNQQLEAEKCKTGNENSTSPASSLDV